MSSSKSRSATTSSTAYTTETLNLNAQGNTAPVVGGDGNAVNVLDGGAIGEAFGFGRLALEANSDIVAEVLTQGARATDNAMRLVSESAQPEAAAGRNLTTTALLAGAVLVAIAYVGKR